MDQPKPMVAYQNMSGRRGKDGSACFKTRIAHPMSKDGLYKSVMECGHLYLSWKPLPSWLKYSLKHTEQKTVAARTGLLSSLALTTCLSLRQQTNVNPRHSTLKNFFQILPCFAKASDFTVFLGNLNEELFHAGIHLSLTTCEKSQQHNRVSHASHIKSY